MSIATFGAGCFWGVEQTFRTTPGVKDTAVGYMGGHAENPTYKEVCTGSTGHAEVVRVEFDEAAITYERLVVLFFELHDPTTLNRQGPDVGTQYRSAIFYEDVEQKAVAESVIERLEDAQRFSKPIVTEVVSAGQFNRAEEYHQQYLAKRGQTSCSMPPSD